MKAYLRTIVAIAAVMLLAGCQGQMRDQISYRPMKDPLPYASGSVPRQGVEKALNFVAGGPGGPTNPVPATEASIARGETLFKVNCAQCHGFDAKGDGKVGELFIPKPFDLTSPAVKQLADGQIYVVITKGFGTMPLYAHHVMPTDRWNIINYLRTIQH